MIFLKPVFNFVRAVSGKTSSRQIAAGLALGAIVGLTPKASLHNVLILILLWFVNINASAVVLSAAIFALFSYLFDPLLNRLGYFLLTQAPPLRPLWVWMYNTPVLPWFKLNNTLVLGSLVAGLLLFWPLYALSVKAINRYRETVVAQVKKWKIVQIIQASKLYGLYQNYRKIRSYQDAL